MTFRFVPAHALLALAVTAFVVAGCSKDDHVTNPIDNTATQQDADDAAQQVGVMVGAENGVMLQPWIVPGSLGARRAPTPLGVTQDTTVHVGAVTWLLTRTFYDSTNATQSAFNANTTARVTIVGDGMGQVATSTDTASYGGHLAYDVSGLQPSRDSLRFSGTRHDTLTTSFESQFRDGRIYTYSTSIGALNGVVQAKPTSTHLWPQSGNVTWLMVVDRMLETNRNVVARRFAATVVVYFDGTPTPLVVVNGVYRYTVDLRTGLLTRRVA
jgi:hypothetical protein